MCTTAGLLLGLLTSTIVVERDNVVIDHSCRVVIRATVIRDADGDGVVHITGNDITVDFAGARLHGARDEQRPDTYTGCGILVTGHNVTLRNAVVSGYKCGIRASGADGLVLEDCDVSGNFRQHLGSTPQAEDSNDWLWPHANDQHEWLDRYGAGIYVERCADVTIRRCHARRGQNGIILSRVTGAKVYDNDCSFLSGWGLALWRSSRNVISRNALDFCIRGYSHGVYNRGQDSAGILMFEQCCDNVIAENSVTHGGDGVFGYAGHEALGQVPPPEADFDYARRGGNGNLLINNDFSYAAAHGIEMTFSFDNRYIGNRIVENAISGIWAGYSQNTLIAGSKLERNGEPGAVAIEHGRNNVIRNNTFGANRCAIHLWSDDDPFLYSLPWSKANAPASRDNHVAANAFAGDTVALRLRHSPETLLVGNTFENVAQQVDATDDSEPTSGLLSAADWQPPPYPVHGETRPVGARPALRGRDKIIITEWGPYDWQEPYLLFAGTEGAAHLYRLLGTEPLRAVHSNAPVGTEADADGRRTRLRVLPPKPGLVTRYTLTVQTDAHTLQQRGVLVPAEWAVRVFQYETDPRQDAERWEAEAATALSFTTGTLDLDYGQGGPSQLPGVAPEVAAAELPRDRFGTLAVTHLTIPAGRWQIETVSDDGVRVWVDDERVIDNWSEHGPTTDTAELALSETRTVKIRVAHFELGGEAVLRLTLRPAD